MDPAQSALESVKGVYGAKVSLEKNEAVVKYHAVRNARGMSRFDAKVKQKGKKKK